MLIKEYRIPLPLDVEEYRIAQLYMIQKKSREESRDTESGVEIIENKPYTGGPGGTGQYTYKIYHIGSHLPGWFRAVLPKSALQVEEEAWNAYPFTKTRYRCPFVDKFLLEIETRYLSDCCQQDNALSLEDRELALREVDIIDIVRDPISSSDYRQDEDPKLFRSTKTCRGPLEDGWREDYRPSVRGDKPVMTAYKVCRVEFKYWGMQNKIERFIHDIALRRTMLRAHRQAWCWQDEYHGLSMGDIRRLERETQLHLAHKMAASLISFSSLSSSSSSCSSIYDEMGNRVGATEAEAVEQFDMSGSVIRLKKSAREGGRRGRGGGREEGEGDSEEDVDEMQMDPLENVEDYHILFVSQDLHNNAHSTSKRSGRKTKSRGVAGVKEKSEWRYQSLEQLQESDNSDEEYFDARPSHGFSFYFLFMLDF
ncbi:phosphatidylinositol transfer protein 2-like [Babylonia areolata]|uniref:phosphatidylinositol transfer protein 2-like n=1 Tax=Babylonia areolata TaxID=304850 RepID=UPI003FCFCE27